jgi:hypothetical protein
VPSIGNSRALASRLLRHMHKLPDSSFFLFYIPYLSGVHLMWKIMLSYPLFCKKVDIGADLVVYVWNAHHRKRFAIEHGPHGLSCKFSAWDVEDCRFESRPGRLNRGRCPV